MDVQRTVTIVASASVERILRMVARRVRLNNAEKQRRKKSKILSGDLLDSYFKGHLEDVIKSLQCLILQHHEYEELVIEEEYYGDYPTYQLVGYNKETDEEYNNRIGKLKADKLAAMLKEEAVEKKLMKQLLKKYGTVDGK